MFIDLTVYVLVFVLATWAGYHVGYLRGQKSSR